MKESQNKFRTITSLLGSGIVALSFIFLAGIAVHGQVPTSTDEGGNTAIHGIMFPVAALGNCANKNECKDYCNQPANMDACIAFAKDHGIMTATDATRAGKFGKLVRTGSGPGGCDSPASCNTYCSTLAHLDECTAFAEKNGFKGDQYEHGKKIQAFLKNGGTTPGSCQTKEECQTYCGDFSHAKECSEFAQKAGIMQKGDSGVRGKEMHEPNAEQLLKLAELSQKGETPGHCTSKAECEKYCFEGSHNEECVNFGIKIGFIQPDEGAKIKQMGGKGPGGCDSQASCRVYCNDQSHQEECLTFAEEHGFITKDESVKTQDGLVRVRMGFENVPVPVKECIQTTLSVATLADIQSGKLVPSPEVVDQIRGCFEKFGGNVRPQEAFKNIPPEVTTCLKEKLGVDFDKIHTGKASMTPEMAGFFRICFQDREKNFTHPNNTRGLRENEAVTKERGGKREGEEMMEPSLLLQNFETILRGAPPEVAACLKEKFPDGFSTIATGNTGQVGMEMKNKIRECFDNFQPTMKPTPSLMPRSIPEGVGIQKMPQEIEPCVRQTLGEEVFQKLQTNPASSELMGVIRTCLEKKNQNQQEQFQQDPILPQPMTYLEKLIGAALLPLRWIFGK